MKKKLGFLVLLSALALPLGINAKEITKDTTLTEEVKDGIIVKNGTTATLDLGGQKVSNVDGDTIKIEKGAKLTIVGNGEVTNNVNDKAVILNEGTLVVKGGTYSRVETATPDVTYYVFLNHGTATIKGGTFAIDSEGVGDPSSLIANGWYDPSKNISKEMSNLTIDDGIFEMKNNNKYIKNDDYGCMTVNGGTFTMNVPSTAVIANMGFYSGKEVVTVNGGSFKYYNKTVQSGGYVIMDMDWNDKGYTDNSKTYVNGGDFQFNNFDTEITNGTIGAGVYRIYDEEETGILHFVVARAEDLEIVFDISELEELSTETVALVKKAIESKYNVAAYYDIVPFLGLNGVPFMDDGRAEVDKEVLVTLNIPSTLKALEKGYNRIYKVVRIHDGEADILDTTLSEDGKSILFKSDKFSVYALVYADEKESAEIKNPETSDTNVVLLISLIALGTVGLGYTIRRKRFN